MKPEIKDELNDELRPEYDFANAQGVRGKHQQRYLQSTNVVALDPDVAAAFHNAQEVNDALRALIRVARDSAGHAA